MNTRQRERVADLGRAFQSALEEIIEMENESMEVYEEEVCREDSYLNYTREEDPIGRAGVCQEELPTPMPVDMNANLAQYDVNIKHVHNGFIVQVGCQTFVFETFDKMAKYMAIYYNDPQGAYEKHYKGELIK